MGETKEISGSTTNNKLIAMILFTFLITFTISRLTVYFVLGKYLPDLFLTIRGVHIHHFTYGVIIIASTNLYLLLRRPTIDRPSFKWLTLLYGIGLGLTFDEFGMWIRLEDNYWIRQSYDAVVIVALLLLNIRYYRYLIRAIEEILHIITFPIRRKKNPST